jgi:hypothetical protein
MLAPSPSKKHQKAEGRECHNKTQFFLEFVHLAHFVFARRPTRLSFFCLSFLTETPTAAWVRLASEKTFSAVGGEGGLTGGGGGRGG